MRREKNHKYRVVFTIDNIEEDVWEKSPFLYTVKVNVKVLSKPSASLLFEGVITVDFSTESIYPSPHDLAKITGNNQMKMFVYSELKRYIKPQIPFILPK